MNGIHDMGGMHGFGTLPLEDEEPVFHESWEARVLATNLALSPHLGNNTDRFRFRIESMPPADYLNASYYERWLAALLAGCAEHDLLETAELDAIERGDIPAGGSRRADALPAQAVRNIITGGKPAVRDHSGEALFKAGQAVRARNIHPRGHTRLVAYARGKSGEILSDNGRHVLPDDHGMGRGPTLQRLYTVRFTALELWGEGVGARDSVCVDLWESYLEHV